jgi:pimeloyl-ACP methyl ester carboxylesterase
MWGGIDAWKEQLTGTSDPLLAMGVATLAMDNPGTGESPVVAGLDAERQFLPVFDWARAQPDLDAEKVGLLGRSFGGYWVTKLCHLHPERIAGGVSWAGGVHFMYQRDWIEASRFPDTYLMELAEARSRMLGAANDAEYIEKFARLSLLDQGVLDRPCAPLLLVNGKEDRQCPIEDIMLLVEHGSPKCVRLFPGGHMGHAPRTIPTMVEWLAAQVGARQGALAGAVR